jgi:hypothetical protein
MSGSLSDKPDGTTSHAQVTNACFAAGERPYKTPIFISGVRDTLSFLARLQAIGLGGLSAHLQAERLSVVPSTAAVSALRSLDGGRM